MRADLYLVEKGYTESRNKASRLIGEGKVLLDGKPIQKPSFDVSDDGHVIEITENEKYVGRGGLKLEGALDAFGIDPAGLRCIDVGASTGGFTDCLLQRGAAYVCAVDAGQGQLHPKLLADIRVSSVEGFNARALSSELFGCFDLAVMDVSFISQTLLHLPVAGVLKEGGLFIALIKPQFEAGKSALGKNGIVKKPADREEAVKRVLESAAACGLSLRALIRSPIEGGDGNREYLACFVKAAGTAQAVIDPQKIRSLCAD